VKEECIYCLTNTVEMGISQQIEILVEFGIIETLLEVLEDCTDPELLMACLHAMEDILNCGREYHGNLYLERFSQANKMEVIRNLKVHPNNDVFLLVEKFLNEYEIS